MAALSENSLRTHIRIIPVTCILNPFSFDPVLEESAEVNLPR